MTSQSFSQTAPLGVALSLGLITAIGPASIDMYLPWMPAMAGEFGAPYAAIQLSLTVFLLAMGIGQLLFGPVIDACGRRKPLLLALAVFIAASFWAAGAQSVEGLILARLLQGLAASLALVTAVSSVRDVAEGAAAAQIFALLATIQGLGPVLAPALGGAIGAEFGWRAVFLALAAFGAAVLANSAFALRETLPPEDRAPLGLGAAARTYLEILSDRRFLPPALSLAFAFVFLFAYIGGAAHVYQAEYGISSRAFGFVFGGTGVAVLIGAMGGARLVRKFPIALLALVGASAMLAGIAIALLSALAGLGLPGIVAGLFVALAGFGLGETMLMSMALAVRDKALGASAALLGAVPLTLGAAATPLAAQAAEAGALWWLGLLLLGGSIAAGLTFASARAAAKSGAEIVARH